MSNFDENAVIERIIQLRHSHSGARGMSKFAKAIGLKSSTYCYYEHGRLPKIPVLLKICEVTGADMHWLLTGEASCRTTAPAQHSELDGKISALLAQSPASEAPILAFVDLLASKLAGSDISTPSFATSKASHPGWIPILGRTAAGTVHFWQQTTLPSAETAVTQLDSLVQKYTDKAIAKTLDGQMDIDLRAKPLLEIPKDAAANLVQITPAGEDDVVQFIESEPIRRLFRDSFALEVDGDSMAPRIDDGDIIVLSPSVPAVEGHVAVVRLGGQIGVTCKIIRTVGEQVHLIPINEKYETKIVSKKDLCWSLAVLCHIKINR